MMEIKFCGNQNSRLLNLEIRLYEKHVSILAKFKNLKILLLLVQSSFS